ncbi:MAG: ABC transporter permease [Hyphomicrobiales bacterium]|nr:ABC transporter permease [Hyphomicrobiales bacterium]
MRDRHGQEADSTPDDPGVDLSGVTQLLRADGEPPATAEADLQVAREHRVLSGEMLHAGDARGALPHALQATELVPENAEFAHHAGIVAAALGDHGKAVQLMTRALQLEPDNAHVLRSLAYSAEQLGAAAISAQLVLRAYRAEPGNANHGVEAAYILARMERWGDAAALLRLVIARGQADGEVHRALSGFLAQGKDFTAALAEIDQAIALEPTKADHYLHRSWLLNQIGQSQEAYEAVEQAIRLNPDLLQARRHMVSVLVEKGDVSAAMREGAELLARAPDEPEYASCMRYLLDVRDASTLAKDFDSVAAAKALAPPRAPALPSSLRQSLQTQNRVIMALVLRDIRGRYGESKISFFWTLMEPFVHVGFLAVVFQFTMHGTPPLGHNFFFFYFTGVMPYLLLSHLILHLGHAVRGIRPLLQLPVIMPTDAIIASAIVELFTTAVIFVVFSVLFAVFGINPIPVHPLDVLGAFALIWMLGTGLGAFCATLFEFGSLGEQFVNIIVRAAYFASGIFYVPAMMPVWVRDILVYNPFLHLIDLMRRGYFADYRPTWADVPYAALVALFSLVIGTALILAFRRSMRTIK